MSSGCVLELLSGTASQHTLPAFLKLGFQLVKWVKLEGLSKMLAKCAVGAGFSLSLRSCVLRGVG